MKSIEASTRAWRRTLDRQSRSPDTHTYDVLRDMNRRLDVPSDPNVKRGQVSKDHVRAAALKNPPNSS